MEKGLNQINKINLIIFGAICGFILYLGEILTVLILEIQIIPGFYFFCALSVLVYVFLGIILALVFWAGTKIGFRLFNKPLSPSRLNKIVLIAIPLGIIFIQGGIIINDLTISGFYSLSSLLIDGVWLILCLVLFLIIFHVLKPRLSYLKIKLTLGLLFSVMGIALLSTALDKNPFKLGFGRLIIQIFELLLVSIICFSMGILLSSFLINIFHRLRLKKNTILSFSFGYLGFISVLFFLILTPIDKNSNKKSNSNEYLKQRPPNIILIVLDTVRADHLSCYDYSRETSPNLDKFCHEAMKFEYCYSTTNWTPPAHASLFTGKFVKSHGSHHPTMNLLKNIKLSGEITCFPLGHDEVTLAEILQEKGYQTSAFVANNAVTRYFGLHQGFDIWYNHKPLIYEPIVYSIFKKFKLYNYIFERIFIPYRIAENINKIVFRWINKRSDKPFFLFINYNDAHDPYLPPPPYNTKFKGKIENFDYNALYDKVRNQEKIITESEIEHIASQYDGEIAYLDSQLGILFNKLKSKGLYANSCIIVTSDHGEFLGEHNLLGHNIELYEPVVRVPLIIKPHNSSAWKAKSNNPVQLIDIFPTILKTLNIQIPDDSQGNPLMDKITHPIILEHYVKYTYLNNKKERFYKKLLAIIKDNNKLISSNDGTYELYDLIKDPYEIDNIINQNVEVANLLLKEIKEWKESVVVKDININAIPKLDKKTLERLKTLGYLK